MLKERISFHGLPDVIVFAIIHTSDGQYYRPVLRVLSYNEFTGVCV